MNKLTRHYLITALWSSTDDNGEDCPDHLDENYDITDISDETVKQAIADCDRFVELLQEADLYERALDYVNGDEEHIGHDFWLTRNHHGCGFWDGDYEDYHSQENSVGDQITALVNKHFKEINLYVGDDGYIYAL